MVYPTSIPSDVLDLINKFYLASDVSEAMDPDAYTKFASLFIEGSSCTTPQGVFTNSEEIAGFRRMAFEKVEKRKHTVREIFVGEERGAGLANGEGSVFIRGRVDFWMKDGTYSENNAWSGRIVFGKNDKGELKFAEYQVYMTPNQH
ncbi:hypothetical protein BDY24DRAFT_415369 [Mrakia frigida]|uniref:uncharacterized protein n=1 Tax=Mrakia frigida TaxID=29902 RepID=UPI003FCBFFAF